MEDEFMNCDIKINLSDILDYVGDSTRPLKEGMAVQEANHIICLGYTKQTTSLVHAKGYVARSSNPNSTPHEVYLKLHKFIKVWDLACSCKANTKRCKHIIACLIQISQFGTLEYISCTDAVQAWGYSKSEKSTLWGARPIQELCCVRRTKIVACTNENAKMDILQNSFERLLKANPASAISKHIEGRYLNPIEFRSSVQSTTDPYDEYCSNGELNQILDHPQIIDPVEGEFNNEKEQSFYNDIVKRNLEEIVNIAVETSRQGNNAWKLHRSIRITASTCYSIFTYTFNNKPDWTKKIKNYFNPKLYETKQMRYGKETEEKAFKCYMRKRNQNVKKTGFVISRYEPWLGASPDGVDLTSRLILEIKCPASGKDHSLNWIIENCDTTKRYLKIKCNELGENIYSLNPKHAYYAQVQVNMFVLNCNKADFVIYSSQEDNFLTVEILFDIAFVKTLIKTLKNIYVNEMLPTLVEKL